MPGLPCTAAVPQRRHPVQLAGPNAHCACGTCASAAHGVALAKLQPRSHARVPHGIAPACATPPTPPAGSYQGWDFEGKCGGRPLLLASLLQRAAGLPRHQPSPPPQAECHLLLTSASTAGTVPREASDPAFPRGLCGMAHLPALAEIWQPTWCHA